MSSDAMAFHETCARCGRSLQDGEWHPVETDRDDGDLALYSFCDDECQSAWVAD